MSTILSFAMATACFLTAIVLWEYGHKDVFVPVSLGTAWAIAALCLGVINLPEKR